MGCATEMNGHFCGKRCCFCVIGGGVRFWVTGQKRFENTALQEVNGWKDEF